MHYSKRIIPFAAKALAAITAGEVALKLSDNGVRGTDPFSVHTKSQIRVNPFSGMHKPYISTDPEELRMFEKYFASYKHLFPTSEELAIKLSAKTPVKMRPMSALPEDVKITTTDILAVGGPPALLSAAALIATGKPADSMTYICDEKGWPIANGSAWHLEEDGPTEAPTSYWPIMFMLDQVLRAIAWNRVTYESVEATGYFPWRTLDWAGWLTHPSEWFTGIKVGILFQLATLVSEEEKTALVARVGKQCKANEKTYHELNKLLGGKLLLPGSGSLIVARTPDEFDEMKAFEADLAKEGRVLKMLTKKEVSARYRFLPKGIAYAEKEHDLVLSPGYHKIVTDYIKAQGGLSINGVLTHVYTEPDKAGGIAEYKAEDGTSQYIKFNEMYMSLGAHPVLDEHDKPLFDVVAARGVSGLAYVDAPVGSKLPPVIVCGGTNHVTKLSESISVEKEGKSYDRYLVRMTASACITPAGASADGAHYDGSSALGLVSAMRHTLGDAFTVSPLVVYGCNRQVSRHGQSNWAKPHAGIMIQYGAGGGGLTRALDAVVKPKSHVAEPLR